MCINFFNGSIEMKQLTGAALFCALMLCAQFSFGQDFSNKGKDFWIGYGNHVRMFNKNGADEKMQLYITSDVSTSGTVQITSIGFTQSFSITANQITTVDIPRTAALMDDGLYNHGIHVTAANPIVVYSFIYVNAQSGATVCLPTATLGREYYSVNFDQLSNEVNSASYFFAIAADTGTTTVEITPSATTKGGKAKGVPFLVTLTQGQVYQVLGSVTGNSGVDLTGSKIRSVNTGSGCKRIAVYCGSGKISIGCTNASSSDNLYQQMYPASTWGKKYITVPGLVNSNNYFRIVKVDPTAVVTLNGVVVPSGSFINSFYYQFINNTPNVIESDKPILVAQYFTTQGCSGNPSPGDPEMIYLNPVEQTIDRVTLNSMQPSVGTNINQHYLNVVIKNNPAAINSFKVDGISYTNFIAVPNDNNFAYARITTTQGTHNISADTGFNIIAYGLGNAESYGYSGGTNLKDLYQFASIKNKYSTVDFPAGCKNSPFFFSITFPYQPTQIRWVFNGLFPDVTVASPVYDSTWTINGKQLYQYRLTNPYSISTVGTFPIKIVAQNPTTDGCTGEQEIEYDLKIFENPKADFTMAATGCTPDSVRFTDGAQANGRPIILWNWDFGNGNSSKLKNPATLYKASGNYTINYSVITDIGCISDTASKTVTITEPPVANFNVSAPGCVERSIQFSDMSTSASSPIVKWDWDFGDGSMATSNTNAPQLHLYKTSGNFKVTLKLVSAAGCTSEVFSKNVLISENPVAAFKMSENCLNDPFSQFTDSSSIKDGTQGQFTYSWNFNDPNATGANPNMGSGKIPKHKFTAVGNYPVFLQVTSNNGCTDTLTRIFTVNGALPVSSFTVANNANCSNEPLLITNNSSVDFGKVLRVEAYWDYANDPSNKIIDTIPVRGKVYSNKYPEFFTPASKDYVIRLVAYSGENCLSSSTQTITIKATPQIKFDSLPRVCGDVLPFQLTQATLVNALPGTGVYSGKGTTASGIFNPSVAGPGNAVVRYTFTGANGCVNYKEQGLTVFSIPLVTAGPDRFLLEGGSIVLAGSGTGTNLSFKWTPPADLDDATKVQPLANPINDIMYRLTATSSDGCKAFDEVMVTVLKTPVVPNTFSPNGDGIHDTWIIPFLETYPGATVDLFNRYGQLVFHSVGYAKPWDGKYNGKPVPVGTYYFVINPKNGRKTMSGFVDVIR